MPYPGETVDDLGRKVTSAIDGVGSSITKGIEDAGSNVQNAVDKPFQGLGVRASPLRILHGPVTGVVRAGSNFLSSGVLGSIEILGHGLTSGIDEVPKAFSGFKGPKNFSMPSMPKEWR